MGTWWGNKSKPQPDCEKCDLADAGTAKVNDAMVFLAAEMDGLADRLAVDLAQESDVVVIRKTLLRETRKSLSSVADQLAETEGQI